MTLTYTVEALFEQPELVRSIPISQLSLTASAVANHAAAVQSKIAAVQSLLAARIMNEAENRNAEGDDRMVTAEEAAKHLRYRLQYVYQLVRENRLTAKREGRKIRIRWGDLKAYIRDSGQNPVAPHLYSTYNSSRDGKRIEIDPKKFGADPSRIRGPRRRRAEFHRPPGTRGDGDPGTAGSPSATAGGAKIVRKEGEAAWEENPSTALTTGRSATTTG